MEDNKYKHVDASSLVDLRAELFKKQEALKQAKLNQPNESIKRKGFKLKGYEPPKKVKSSPKSSVNTAAEAVNLSEEEEKQLQKTRTSLERKAKLYDLLVTKTVPLDDDDADNYMVDFRKKIINHNDIEINKPTPKEENIEIESVSTNNSYDDFFVKAGKETDTFIPNQNKDSATPSEGPIHYQNVQYNEVRDHGIGYFKFSQDEAERKEQLDLLNVLRQKTEQRKAAYKTSEEKRQAALQARLAKICERRNIDKTVIDSLVPKKDPNDDALNKPVHDTDIDNIPLPEGHASSSESNKPIKVRPWDKGKQLIDSEVIFEKRKRVNQKSWIEDRRTERNNEFAPPSTYN